jgi:hypothetical protein
MKFNCCLMKNAMEMMIFYFYHHKTLISDRKFNVHNHTWASRGVLGPKIRIGPKGYCQPKKNVDRRKSRNTNSYIYFGRIRRQNMNWSINFSPDTTN